MLNINGNYFNLVDDVRVLKLKDGKEFVAFKGAFNPPNTLKDDPNYQTTFADITCFNPYVVALMKNAKKGENFFLHQGTLRKMEMVPAVNKQTGEYVYDKDDMQVYWLNVSITAEKIIKPQQAENYERPQAPATTTAKPATRRAGRPAKK